MDKAEAGLIEVQVCRYFAHLLQSAHSNLFHVFLIVLGVLTYSFSTQYHHAAELAEFTDSSWSV